MFANFIYTIIVLLLYLSYQAPDDTYFTTTETLCLFFGLIAFFYFISAAQFKRVIRQISLRPHFRLDNTSDHQFNTVLRRQCISAVVLFAVDLYWLHIPWYVSKISLSSVPTIQGLFFIGLFIFYLSTVWYLAYPSYQKLYMTRMTRRSYIYSNILFNFPIVFPWLLLSGFMDIVDRLPFEQPKQFLSTTTGEVCYFMVLIFAIAVIGPIVIQKTWRCRPLEPGITRLRIQKLCERAGLAYADILYLPIFGSRMITAGVMGLINKFRYLLITRSLLQILDPDELDAVIAHEIGHVKQKHLLLYLIFFSGYLLFSYTILELLVYMILYSKPLFGFFVIETMNSTAVASLGISLITLLTFFIYFRYIFGYFMRNFERQADTYVYELLGSAQPLISTFNKITVAGKHSPDTPNWHHFSISERIEYLDKCEKDRSWISAHNTKVKKSIAFYITGCVLTGVLAYQLGFGEIGTKLNTHHLEKVLLSAIEKNPFDPDLFRTLGDLYYSTERIENAIDAYNRSLSINPDNPEVLNNLAWLYATTKKKNIQNPVKALRFAVKAAGLKKSAHIFDSLAESYFINGKYKEAVAAATIALKLSQKNQIYYKDQLEKFRQSVEKYRGIRTDTTSI